MGGGHHRFPLILLLKKSLKLNHTMFELFLLAIGAVGFGLAGYLDLKTTEFPGWIPYGIIVSVLIVLGIDGFITNNFSLITNSVFQGLLFLFIGLAFYFSKQWGDGDAWLLGSLGFLLPTRLVFTQANGILPFYLVVFFNFLIVCLFYIIVYSIVLGCKNKKVRNLFFLELKKGYKMKVFSIILFSVFCVSAFLYFNTIIMNITTSYLLLFPLLLVCLIVLADYTKLIEKYEFRKRVLTRRLKPGDVVFGGKWKGLTIQDIKKIKTKYVIVKEGVRLAPVFLLAFLITILFGNLLWFI